MLYVFGRKTYLFESDHVHKHISFFEFITDTNILQYSGVMRWKKTNSF